MKPEIVLWGGGSQARALRPIVEACGSRVVAVVDDTKNLASPFEGVPILCGMDAFRRWLGDRERSRLGFAIAIGNPHAGVRLELHDALCREGLTPETMIHPTAILASDVELGPGCQVFAGAIVASAARIGRQSIINSRALVEHDTMLGEGVEISPGAVVLGLTHIGRCSFIGASATVLSRLSLGERVSVAAGAVVDANVTAGEHLCSTTKRIL